MERNSRPNRRLRFLQSTEERQGAGEEILCCGMSSIDLNGASKTIHRLVVAAEIELRDAGVASQEYRYSIPGTETHRLSDMGLGFLEASDDNLGETNDCVSFG